MNKKTKATRAQLNEFLEKITDAIQNKRPDEDMASMEAPRVLIEHFFGHDLKGFDKVGFSVYHNVRVFEEGKREEAEARLKK